MPAELAAALVEELRRRRILLPTPGVLDLLIHEARARAERGVHRAMTGGDGRDAAGRAGRPAGGRARFRPVAAGLAARGAEFAGGPDVWLARIGPGHAISGEAAMEQVCCAGRLAEGDQRLRGLR